MHGSGNVKNSKMQLRSSWISIPHSHVCLMKFVLENMVLKKMFEPKREIAGGWRKLHSKELDNLCYYCA